MILAGAPTSRPRENTHRLHMMRMRKHVRNARREQPISMLMHQRPRIAGEGRRVARDIRDAPRRHFGHLPYHRLGTGARRVEHYRIPILPQETPPGLIQVGRFKLHVLQTVEPSIGRRPSHESTVAFNAEHLASLPGKRQAEIAQAAVEVKDAVGGTQLQQAYTSVLPTAH